MLVRDQVGEDVEVPARAGRIVSLCPSTTETLFALGAGGRVVGRTDYCCEPADEVESVATVGGTKTIRIERVERVQPDLILAVKEENDREQVEALRARWPVVVLDPVDVDSAIDGIECTGTAIGQAEDGREMADEIRRQFAELPDAAGIRVAYLIWRKPWMVAGPGTYIDDLLTRLGFVNVAGGLPAKEGRYPALDATRLKELRPAFLLASSEPFPFSDKHIPELREAVPSAEPVLVDGQAFSWHGSRMRHATGVFRELISGLEAAGRG